MKTIFTLLTSLFMSIAVFAAARPQSILTIKSADNADIRVVLDGRSFDPNDNSMMIRGIDDGYHTIKVFRQRRGGASLICLVVVMKWYITLPSISKEERIFL